MSTTTKVRSALRATLKKEDAALEERLVDVPPAAPKEGTTGAESAPEPAPAVRGAASAGAAPAAPGRAARKAPARRIPAPIAKPQEAAAPTVIETVEAAVAEPEKRQRASFKLAPSDCRRLEVFRDDIRAAGHRATRSELLRAGLLALAALGTNEVIGLIKTLPAKAGTPKAETGAANKAAGKAGKRRAKSARKKR